MNKKALVLAIGAALAMQGAFAQKKPSSGGGSEDDSQVVLYGKVYPEFVWPSGNGATAAGTPTCSICGTATGTNSIIKRTEMESSNSRFGIRGYEKLGGNLKAIYQLETQFLLDSNNTAFAARDSFMGIQGGWGTVKLGRMDTPFKEYGDDLSFLNVSSGNFTSTSSVYRNVGFGTQNSAARFHERRTNVVQYESPDFGPLDFKVQWSTNEAKDDANHRDPRVLSMGGKYELGPVTFMVGYEIHYDLFGLSANVPSALRNNAATSGVNSKDEAIAGAVQWKIGRMTFEVDGNKKQYDEPNSVAGKVRSYENNAYMFLWDWRVADQWRIAAHYVKATAGKCQINARECNTNGLSGNQTSAGFAYNFSRKTYLFVMGSWVRNGTSSVFNNSNAQSPSVGEDIRQVGIGLHTTF